MVVNLDINAVYAILIAAVAIILIIFTYKIIYAVKVLRDPDQTWPKPP